MNELHIRSATPADAADIARIYNHYIKESTATFDTAEKTEQERVQWLADHGEGFPVLVAERDGDVIGWGSISPFRERPAYRHTVELGIYLRDGETRAGVGPLVLDALIKAAEKAGHHALMGQVVSENEASLRMLERAGFSRVGYLPEVGCKFGRWLDLVIVERLLPVEVGC